MSEQYAEQDSTDLDSPERVAALLAGVRNGTWLHTQKFDALGYAVPGLLPEGFALLVGAPKAGKSWLALALLLAVASPEGKALGKLDTGAGREVLYLALEDGDRRMQDRCRALLGNGNPIPERFHYVTKATPKTVLPIIEVFLREHPETALVILDTLGKVMPPALPGEGAYERDYRIGGRLKLIADSHAGLALVVLHHNRKAMADDFVDSVSGTNGLAGAADTIIVLDRKRHSTSAVLKVTGRDVHEAEYAITTSGGAWSLDGATLDEAEQQATDRRESVALSDRSMEVINVAKQHPGGVRAADVAAALAIDAAQARTYLNRLAESGRLDRLARGLFSAPAPVPNTVATVMSVMNGSTDPRSQALHNTHHVHNAVPTEGEPCEYCGKPIEPEDGFGIMHTWCAEDFEGTPNPSLSV